MHRKTWWGWIAHFIGHTVIGSMVFLIIAAPAVALSFLMKYLEAIEVSHFTVQVLGLLEHGILVVDALLFVIYLLVTAYQAIEEMLK